MQLKTTIKASSVQHLTDARYFAAWGTEWIGFRLSPEHSSFLHPQQVKAIIEWLSGSQIVGEFATNQSMDDINQVIDYLGLNTVQLPYNGNNLDTIKSLAQKVSVVTELASLDNIEEVSTTLAPLVSFIIVHIEDWTKVDDAQKAALKNACATAPIMLSIQQLDEKQTLTILDTYAVYGFELTGGAEEKVGYKSFDEIDPIFEALEDEGY